MAPDEPEASAVIRPVAAGDLPALMTVVDDSGLFPGEVLREMTAGYLAGEEIDGLWLTIDDGGPQAIAFCEPERMTEGTWNVLLIAVRARRQGQGLGAAMMGQIERMLAARGARIVLVETSGVPDFERTRAFYRRIGYDEEARIRDYYADGDDKVVFWKSLRPDRA